MSLLSDGLFLPAIIIAFLAWLVPKLLSAVLPEGVKPLVLNAAVSTFALFTLSTVFFVLLYIWQGVNWSAIADYGMAANVLFFGKLGLISAIIWAPIMVLTLANLPRYWVTKVW